MAKPLIGITCDYRSDKPVYSMNQAYCEAVSAAGGLPVVLPFRSDRADIPALLDRLDAVLFSGGDDLDPSAWGEERHPMARPVDPARERYERALLAQVERRRTPTLGICLGSQLMNVYRGGTMHQFIPDLRLDPHIEHRKLGDADPRHDVSVEPGSLLSAATGAGRVLANSAHKQAFAKIGAGLRVVAKAPDGVPEAIEDPSFPLFIGVQWHPERIHTEPAQHEIFKLLVARASGR